MLHFWRSFLKYMGCSIDFLTDFEINAKNTNTEGSTLIVATIPIFMIKIGINLKIITVLYFIRMSQFVSKTSLDIPFEYRNDCLDGYWYDLLTSRMETTKVKDGRLI